MFNLTGSEIIVILLLALVVLGPEKLPDAIRRFSQTYSELKKMGTGFQDEFKSAMDEPLREMRETAQLVQDAADPQKMAEQAEEAAEAQAAEAKRAQADAAAAAGIIGTNGADERPEGTLDPGASVAEGPPVVINEIAAANARSKIPDPVADTSLIPTVPSEPADLEPVVPTPSPVSEAPLATPPPPPPATPMPPPPPTPPPGYTPPNGNHNADAGELLQPPTGSAAHVPPPETSP